MGNQNKKQARSISNPNEVRQVKEVEIQHQNDIKSQERQTPKVNNSQEIKSMLSSEQINPSKRLQKQENDTYQSLRQKRSISEVNSSAKQHFKQSSIQDVRNSQQTPENRAMKAQGGGQGKMRKSLEDVMLQEINKLKKYSPQKRMDQAQNQQQIKQQKQQILTNQQINNNGSIVKINQTSNITSHSYSNSQNNSPTQKQKRSQSPDLSNFGRTGLYIPQQFQGTKMLNVSNTNNSDRRLEDLSQFKKEQQREKQIDNFSTRSPLQRSQTNPKRRQNWELIIKQMPGKNKKEFSATQYSLNHTQVTNVSRGKQKRKTPTSINFMTPELMAQSLVTMNLQSQSQINQNLPQLSLSQNQQTDQCSLNQIIPNKKAPPRIEELFSIYEGGKKKSCPLYEKSMKKEKASYLSQINEILTKKYQTNSKKKIEFERIEPYVRSQKSGIIPRLNQISNNQSPMFIVNTPHHQEESDFQTYSKQTSSPFRNTRSSTQEQTTFSNASKHQNKLLRYQLNPLKQRSSSNGYQENLKNLQKFRNQIPFQIQFDNQQHDILNKSRANKFDDQDNNFDDEVQVEEYNNKYQQQNTFYNHIQKQSQTQDEDLFNLDKSQKDTESSFNPNQFISNYINQPNHRTDSDANQKINNTHQQSNSHTQPNEKETSNYFTNGDRTSSPQGTRFERDNLDSSCALSTKHNFNNQQESTRYAFQDFNNNHLSSGFEKMRIRKYQNSSQIGVIPNSDIYKIYMKNPVLDVYTSTLKQSQKLQSNNNHKSQKSDLFIYNQSFISSKDQVINSNPGLNQLQESRNNLKQQLIKTYQPIKLNHIKTQQS